MTTDNAGVLLFNRFRIITKLGQGSFGQIFKGIDTSNNRLVALKLETSKGSSHGQLKTESKIYQAMDGVPINENVRWPKLHSFKADNHGCSILVMDLLGPNIDSLLQRADHKRFAPETVAYFAEKMIDLVERFHANGFVHRDLKPQNFVIELCEKKYPKYPEVYLIDYGLAKSYIEPDKHKHAQFVQHKSLKGTVRYSSVNTHLGIDQSRRDDVQSLGYIILYMLLGKLPWQNLMKGHDKSEAYHHIMILKMKLSCTRLVETLHDPIKTAVLSYLLYVNALMYHEKPNYAYMKSLFQNIASSFQGNIFSDNLRIRCTSTVMTTRKK
jgi:serine/threonine protein kinase